MTASHLSVHRFAFVLAALALTAGAAVAQAAGGADPKPRAPRAVPAPGVAIVPAQAALVEPAPLPAACRRPKGTAAAKTPPSDALKDAFAILRRERKDEDALPAKALEALKAHRLEPVDPQSARLLRADGDARAWVVPVPDVGAGDPFACARSSKPREGLAVVSIGGAPAGGGGALADLKRGLAPAAIDPCAGADRKMLGVSGIVPDGVEAVFVTAADGSATRADVHDNGFAFVLPRERRPSQRYLVWTGTDGKPHVQPVPALIAGGTARGRLGCAPVTLPRVTPDPFGASCLAFGSGLPARPIWITSARRRPPRPASRRRNARPAPARPAPAPRRRPVRGPLPAAPPPASRGACVVAMAPPVLLAPAPRPAPRAARPPRTGP